MHANRLIPAAVLLCLLAGGAAAQNTGKTVRKHRVAEVDPNAVAVREAEAAIEKQDYPTAEAKLKAVTAANPGDYQAWYYLGYIYGQTERPADAAAAYRRSVAAKPDVFETNFNLGLLLARGNDSEAEKFLRAATRLKPVAKAEEGRGRAWLALARVVEASRPQEAVAAYAEAAKLMPKDAEPHIAAGILLEGLKRPAEAELEFRQALELDPKSAEALAGLVNVTSEQRRYAEAEALLRKYLAADPQHPTARAQLGRVLAAQKKYAEAAGELEAGLAATPDDAPLARELAAVYTEAGKWDKAAPLYEKLIQQQPKDAELRRVYGLALMHQLHYPEAQQQLVTSLRLDPKQGDVYGDLAFVAAQNKNYQLALQALDARAQYVADTPATFFLRATCFDHLKLFKEASEYYKRFLDTAGGQFPDQEWQARHRLKAIDPKSR
jgi:tetratricopeptide (TPR) repeat protein